MSNQHEGGDVMGGGKIIEYFIIQEVVLDKLSVAVNKLLSEGYELYGQPFSGTIDQFYDEKVVDQVMVYSQAMVKREVTK